MDYAMLMEAAREARNQAYCRYSHYAVGAALLTEDGTVYTGCNIENAAYPMCLCAERTAIAKAVSEGHRRFPAIAVCGAPEGEQAVQPCSPCGACRQVIAEFLKPGEDTDVIMTDGCMTIRGLLPKSFTLEE